MCGNWCGPAEMRRREPGRSRRRATAGPRQGDAANICREPNWKTRSARTACAGCATADARPERTASAGAGLAEHLHLHQKPGVNRCSATRGAGLPIAVVRPPSWRLDSAAVPGWNEGINTSAPLSYLLGTNFPPVALQREEAVWISSRWNGLPGHDPHRRRPD